LLDVKLPTTFSRSRAKLLLLRLLLTLLQRQPTQPKLLPKALLQVELTGLFALLTGSKRPTTTHFAQ
jgi:hypothetical protein